MEPGVPFVVAASAHPSLDDALRRFAANVHDETRYFGRRGTSAAKPTPSLMRRLTASGLGNSLAAVVDGEIIGVARIDDQAIDGPELLIAVALPWRGRGVALALGQQIVARAHDRGVPRIVLRTSHRAADVRELGNALGFQVFDLGRGRLDLVRTLTSVERSA